MNIPIIKVKESKAVNSCTSSITQLGVSVKVWDSNKAISLVQISTFKQTAALPIRGGIDDNSKKFFSYFSMKTYAVTPH